MRETLLDAATVAAEHTLPRFRTALAVDNKLTTGFDPVTDADREAERAIRALLAERFPDHGIIGEELEDKATTGRFAWIIDPIDGTRAFITGVPVWGTLLGLMVDGRAVAGLMAQPFTGEIYLSVPGHTHYHRGKESLPLKTSGVTELSKARLTATSPDLFLRSGRNLERPVGRHQRRRPHRPLRPRLLRLLPARRRPHRPRRRSRPQERRHRPADPDHPRRRRHRHDLGRRSR